MPRPPSDAPDRILEAAGEILKTSGPTALSFDRLADATGLSKGGVLHHYRTRRALITALVQHSLATLQDRIDQRMARDEQPQGAFRRAWAGVLLDAVDQGPGPGLLAAAVEDPALLEPLWAWLARCRRKLAAEVGDAEALVLTGAALAPWLAHLLGGPALDATQRTHLRARLLR